MSKLIYAPNATIIEATYQSIKTGDPALNDVFHSIAFTGDGYLYTHGKKFRLFLVQNEGFEGIQFNITSGVAQLLVDGVSMGSGNVITSISGDNIVCASTSGGVTSLTHKQYLTLTGSTLQYGSNTKIPIITVDQYGHISAISEGTSIDPNKIIANTTQTTGNYYLTGVTDNTSLNPIYSTSTYIELDGKLHAPTIYEGNKSLSELYAAIGHITTKATDSVLGHVKLFDSADADKDKDAAYAATPKAVATALSDAQTYTRNLIAALDAMVFVGTIKADRTIMSHNNDLINTINDTVTKLDNISYKVGYTFRFTEGGTFGTSTEVEVGDMLIAVKDINGQFDETDWTVIQTNISGALTATSALNGLLYANNSRTVSALALSSGVLSSNGTTMSFVNPNTLWRDIQVNDTSIGVNTLNLKTAGHVSYSVTNGEVTLSVNDAEIIATAASLTIKKANDNLFSYNPSTAGTLILGDLLTLDTQIENDKTYKVLKHAAGTKVTNKFGSITTDNYGHITSITDVTSLQNPYSLVFRNNAGTDMLSYKGDTEDKVVKIKNGTDIEFSLAINNTTNELEITPSITHKYRPVNFWLTIDSESATALLADNTNTALTLKAGNNITISNVDGNNTSLGAGVIAIHAIDSWRTVEAYSVSNSNLSRSSIGTSVLLFDDSLLKDNNGVGLYWTEIDEEGRTTYVK